MSQSAPKPRDIYADLAALPANMVGEIVNGTLHAHPRPARPHARATTNLGGELYNPFLRGRDGPGGWIFLDEMELHLGEHIVVPDISGWKVERYSVQETTSFSIVVPDWICEVASPSTKLLDRFQKLPIYARHGVTHCWYVDPLERTLEVFILANGAYIIGPTFTDADAVTAAPFEAHTFLLDVLWEDPTAPQHA